MADYEIIEADFQQFYNLDLSTLKFRRYARLLANLPPESRFFQKTFILKDWSWDKEVQSRILQMLDLISCHLVNANRKKGAKALKPGDQFQPDYVVKAKKQIKADKKEANADSQEELAAIFEKRNNKVKDIEKRVTNDK